MIQSRPYLICRNSAKVFQSNLGIRMHHVDQLWLIYFEQVSVSAAEYGFVPPDGSFSRMLTAQCGCHLHVAHATFPRITLSNILDFLPLRTFLLHPSSILVGRIPSAQRQERVKHKRSQRLTENKIRVRTFGLTNWWARWDWLITLVFMILMTPSLPFVAQVNFTVSLLTISVLCFFLLGTFFIAFIQRTLLKQLSEVQCHIHKVKATTRANFRSFESIHSFLLAVRFSNLVYFGWIEVRELQDS